MNIFEEIVSSAVSFLVDGHDGCNCCCCARPGHDGQRQAETQRLKEALKHERGDNLPGYFPWSPRGTGQGAGED